MATTTDTLIFEIQVKDDASKVFDAWDKRLKDLESRAQKTFNSLSTSITKGFSGNVFGGFLTAAKSAFSAFGDLAKAAFRVAWDGIQKMTELTIDFGKKSMDAFVSFETELALVSKTTGLTGGELKKLGDEIRDLAKPIGALKAEDLLKVAQVAGQLGIQGTESIKTFSVAIGKGAIALDKFGGSTEKLGLHMAKSQNIFSLTVTDTEAMLSVLDKLSKTTAANELEISNFNMQMGQFQAQMKLSYQEASAWGAAMVSAGFVGSKAATQLGSAYTRVTTDTNALVSATTMLTMTADGGASAIARLEEITGKSRDQFSSLAQMLQTALGVDSFNAMNLLAQSMTEVKNVTGDTSFAVDAFGKVGLKAMGALGEQQQALTQITRDSNGAFLEATSYLDSYERQIAKSGEQFNIFESVLNDIYLTVGEKLVGAFGKFYEENLIPILDEFATWLRQSELMEQIFPRMLENARLLFQELIAKAAEFIRSIDWDNFFRTIEDGFLQVTEYLQNVDFAEVFNSLKTAATAAFKFITDTLPSLISLLGKASGSVEDIKDLLGLLKRGWEAFNIVIEYTRKVTEPVFQIITSSILAITDDTYSWGQAFGDVVDSIKSAVKTVNDSIVGLMDGIIAYGAKAITTVGELAMKIKNMIPFIKDADKEATGNSLFPDIVKWGDMSTSTVGRINEQIAAMPGQLMNAENALSSASEKVFQLNQLTAKALQMMISTPGLLNARGLLEAQEALRTQGPSLQEQYAKTKQPTPPPPPGASTSTGIGGGSSGNTQQGQAGSSSLTVNLNGFGLIEERAVKSLVEIIQPAQRDLMRRTSSVGIA